MPRNVTWLHLSDLHAYAPATGWDARRILAEVRPLCAANALAGESLRMRHTPDAAGG